MKPPVYILAFCALLACSGSSPSAPRDIERSTLVDITATPPELATAVHIDSVSWRPRLLLPDPFDPNPSSLDLSGTYAVFFRNIGQVPLLLRYDLRFFDLDGFLIDVFNPFGLPLRLEPGQTLQHGDAFEIRAADPRQLEELATLQVSVQVQSPPEP